MDREILSIVGKIQARSAGGVYAWQVCIHLEKYPRSERTIRERMRILAESGQLTRLGERQGYKRAVGRVFYLPLGVM